jgi:hypothetical protein
MEGSFLLHEVLIVQVKHLTTSELEAGLDVIRQSPRDHGVLALIVRRPRPGERDVLTEGRLDLADGLVGDGWRHRRTVSTPDGAPHPDKQLTIMNVRAVALVAQAQERWPLAGDQLYMDLDLSGANLPPGTRLAIGETVIEVTAEPHTGCQSFTARFGRDAMQFVNSPVGRQLNLRGINARVVRAGLVRVGDVVTVSPSAGIPPGSTSPARAGS